MRRTALRTSLTLALLAAILPAAPAHAAVTCDGREVTIFGTDRDDVLPGTPGDDVIHGFQGNDTIDGLGGNDVICGGAGNDDISGGDGDDLIIGGGGRDTLDGDDGDDTIRGGAGHDELIGGADDDVLVGGAGADVALGGAGMDLVYGNSGNDELDGGSKRDILVGGNGADTLLGRAGRDVLAGGAHADSMYGGYGDDVLKGGKGRDLLHGGRGADVGLSGPGWDVCLSTTRDDGCEGPTFLETFTGSPASPEPFTNSAEFSVSVNSRIGPTQHELATMDADHTTECDPPPGTHVVTAYEDALYQCHDHLMTAVSSGLFTDRTNMAVAMFSPNQVLDFSGGPAVIRFDASTLRGSRRDWFDIWVTPFEDLQRVPIQADRVLLQGPSENALVVALRAFSNKGVFDASVFNGFVETKIEGSSVGYESVITPSRKIRSTFEIIVERDHLKVWMPEEGLVFIDSAIPELPFDKGIVQFGHNSYEVFECETGCAAGPVTWHWDNIELTPAEPLRALPASRRFVNETTASFVDFSEPAPAGSWVQFTAIGRIGELEVSFDSGATWQTATRQHDQEVYIWRYRNFWMPVPAGTTTMHMRGVNSKEHLWQFQDISILVLDDNT